ncbi:hypothetical protein BDR26DRAFT_650212 [Obelidium mucronatum]|nr:hypothetical protein BDR26DRAFT_650212 [Obelidium mucronatum]
MDDLEEYEEKFPFRGRTPGGTHHPRSQTHDPDDHYRRSNQNSDALESEATKDQKPVRAATSEPIKTKKKSHEVVAPPKTMNMTTTEPEEPLVSIPSRHHSAKSQLVQISDAAGTQAKSPDLTPKTDSDIIPEELPAVLNDQVPLTRQATIPSAEIPEESLATASSKAGSEVKLNDQPIEEVISSGSTYSLVDKSPVETNVEAKLEVEEASQMPTEDTSNHTDDPRTTLSDSENRAEEPVVASVPQTVDSTPEPETSSSQQNIKSSKNNVSSIPPSAIPKSLKGSTKSLIKAASESHVISNSRTGSKSKLNNPPSPALPSNSKKGSTKSLVKAASESRVIGKGGSLAGSKSKLNQSFVVSSKTGSIKSLSKGEPPEAQPTEATETKETTEQPSEQDDPSLEY